MNDLGKEAIELIKSYAKSWDLLLAYDEENLNLPPSSKPSPPRLNYPTALAAIESFRIDLSARDEAAHFFGQEKDGEFERILNTIEQTTHGEPLYKTAEEKASHLFYCIIQDRPFMDGNKRIGGLIFLLYLKSQNMPIKFNDRGLVTLVLLVAESDPNQKEMIIKLIVNLLVNS